MSSAARQFFDSIKSYADLEALITNGETEGLFIECKSPSAPQLTRELRATLQKAISGFSNCSGGVVIWGMSTTKHIHGSLDVMSQLEPLGNCKSFMQQVTRAALTATTPAVQGIESKIILESSGATRGVVLTYIPQTTGDPVQTNNEDRQFYFRSGDEFSVAPYELIKRLFAATDSPDLTVDFQSQLVTAEADGTWNVPILISNRSSAAARAPTIFVSIENPSACHTMRLPHFQDASSINPGKKIFSATLSGTVYRGMNNHPGTLSVKMNKVKHDKRVLKISVQLFCDRMRARSVYVTISLAKKGFSIKDKSEEFMY